MRAYDIHASALALDVHRKWLDNTLSHHRVPGVVQSRQGVRRLVPPQALRVLAVALECLDAGLALGPSLVLAGDALRSGGRVRLSSHASLQLDLEAIDRRLERRLADAVESAAAPRRGRPPAAPGGRRPPSSTRGAPARGRVIQNPESGKPDQ